MRRGLGAQLLFTPKRDMLGFSTGSQFCSEHEWGSEELMVALVKAPAVTESKTVQMLKDGSLLQVPTFEERRGITQSLDELVYGEQGQGELMTGVFGFSARGIRATAQELMACAELNLNRGRKASEVVGAWDQGSFGLAVQGEQRVKRLRRFVEGVRQGDGLFAGSFMKDERGCAPSGVCIVLKSLLMPEQRAAMKAAQDAFTQGMRTRVA